MTTKMSALDMLRGARELLSDPAHWTQGVAARNAAGEEVKSYSGDAVCWCVYGALGRVVGPEGNYAPASAVLCKMVPDWLVSVFNDTHEHAEVLDLLDRAIAKEGARV